MTDTLLVLFGLWCFAAFCFGFGWIMGHAAAMDKQADRIIGRFPLPLSRGEPRPGGIRPLVWDKDSQSIDITRLDKP